MKFLYGGSILGFLAAMLIVVSGQTTATKEFFAPGGGLEKGVGKAARTPIEQAHNTGAEVKIRTILQEATSEIAGQRRVDGEAVRAALRRTSSHREDLRTPIERGGIEIFTADKGRVLIFCAKPARYYCASFDVQTRAKREGRGRTLATARAEVS